MKKRTLYFFGVICLIALFNACDTTSSVEDPNKNYFIKYIGGDGDQEGVDMIVNADGTIYLFGNTQSSIAGAKQQLYLVLVDEFGQVIWERAYGDPNFNYEARDIEPTNDGRLVFVANKEIAVGNKDILIMTLDLIGARLDSVVFGFPGNKDEVANSVSQTSDGFIVAGYTLDVAQKPSGSTPPNDIRDAISIRYFNDLTIYPPSWDIIYGPGTFDEAIKIIQTNSSPDRFYFFGSTNSPALLDIDNWVFQLGANGGAISAEIIPGNKPNDDLQRNVSTSLGQGFLLSGKSVNPTSGGTVITLIRIRNQPTFTSSDILANVTIPGNNLEGISSYPLQSGGYLVIGNESGGTTNRSIYLLKVNNDLTLSWTSPPQLLFGGINDDFAGNVAELPDGRILIFGTMSLGNDGQKKMALIKLNKDGKFLD